MQVALNKSAAEWAYFAYQSIETGYPLQDVHVITARSHYIDSVCIAAAETLLEAGEFPTMSAIIAIADQQAQSMYTAEKVVVNAEGVMVFINVEEIDDQCIPTVCSMVQEALDQLDGAYGEITFGKPLQFSVEKELQLAYH